MTDHVVSALTKRRANLSGQAEVLRAQLARIAADLVHLDAVIRQFDPTHDLAAIRPKRPRGSDVARRGERSRALLAVLREASEPIPAAEVVRRMMAQQGQDAGDTALAGRLAKCVETALGRQVRRGTVRVVREMGRAARWETVKREIS